MKSPFYVKALKSLSSRPDWRMGDKATHRYLDYFLTTHQTDVKLLNNMAPDQIARMASALFEQNASLGSPVSVPNSSADLTFKELLLIERRLLEYQIHHSGPTTDVNFVKTFEADPNHLPASMEEGLEDAFYPITLLFWIIILTITVIGIFLEGRYFPETKELFYDRGVFTLYWLIWIVGVVLKGISRLVLLEEYGYHRAHAISGILPVSDTWDQVFRCETFADASLLSMIADHMELDGVIYMRWGALTPKEAQTFCLSLSGFGMVINIEEVAEHHLGGKDTTTAS